MGCTLKVPGRALLKTQYLEAPSNEKKIGYAEARNYGRNKSISAIESLM
jgi:hypothetical protein